MPFRTLADFDASLAAQNPPGAAAAAPVPDPTHDASGHPIGMGTWATDALKGFLSSPKDLVTGLTQLPRQVYKGWTEDIPALVRDPSLLKGTPAAIHEGATYLGDNPQEFASLLGQMLLGKYGLPKVPGAAKVAIEKGVPALGRATSAVGRGVEATGKFTGRGGPGAMATRALTGELVGGHTGAAIAAGGPPVLEATGRGLQRVGAATESADVLGGLRRAASRFKPGIQEPAPYVPKGQEVSGGTITDEMLAKQEAEAARQAEQTPRQADWQSNLDQAPPARLQIGNPEAPSVPGESGPVGNTGYENPDWRRNLSPEAPAPVRTTNPETPSVAGESGPTVGGSDTNADWLANLKRGQKINPLESMGAAPEPVPSPVSETPSLKGLQQAANKPATPARASSFSNEFGITDPEVARYADTGQDPLVFDYTEPDTARTLADVSSRGAQEFQARQDRMFAQPEYAPHMELANRINDAPRAPSNLAAPRDYKFSWETSPEGVPPEAGLPSEDPLAALLNSESFRNLKTPTPAQTRFPKGMRGGPRQD